MQPFQPKRSSENAKDGMRSIGIVALIAFLVYSMTMQYARLRSGNVRPEMQEVLQLVTGKPEEAHKKLEALLAQRPEDLELHREATQVCQLVRRWDWAVPYARRTVELSMSVKDKQTRANDLAALANVQMEAQSGDWKREVLESAKQAYQLQPKDPQMMNLYGYALADLSTNPTELERATPLLKDALEMAEGRVRDASATVFLAAVRDSYGWLLYRKGDYKGAVIALSRAIDTLPAELLSKGKTPEIGKVSPDELKVFYYHLGAAYRKADQPQEAKTALERSLRLDPKYLPAQEELQALTP
jgi:tetratricopeptide (TPR) repeat protein